MTNPLGNLFPSMEHWHISLVTHVPNSFFTFLFGNLINLLKITVAPLPENIVSENYSTGSIKLARTGQCYSEDIQFWWNSCYQWNHFPKIDFLVEVRRALHQMKKTEKCSFGATQKVWTFSDPVLVGLLVPLFKRCFIDLLMILGQISLFSVKKRHFCSSSDHQIVFWL